MDGYYILLLEDGNFVSYEKINDEEIELCPVTWQFADTFPTLEEAQNEAKAISNKQHNGIKIHSHVEVEVIMKVVKEV